jgi:O-methyltransferase
MGLRKIIRKKLFPDLFLSDYHGDGLATKYKTLPFVKDVKLAEAWRFAEEGNESGWKGSVPDIRWRAHIACWAAQHGLSLEGDFVECGVHTGILSMAICKYLDFERVEKKFYLFDTYEGIPIDQITPDESDLAHSMNKNLYFDCLEIVQRNFSNYPNAIPVKGRVPESFENIKMDKIAYLSLDMNNATAERAAIEYLWPKLVPGAIVVLDDYGWTSHKAQMVTIDEFAASQNVSIAHLPTGQGLLIKP